MWKELTWIGGWLAQNYCHSLGLPGCSSPEEGTMTRRLEGCKPSRDGGWARPFLLCLGDLHLPIFLIPVVLVTIILSLIKSGRSQATDASALYENHFNLTQMGLLADNLIRRAP